MDHHVRPAWQEDASYLAPNPQQLSQQCELLLRLDWLQSGLLRELEAALAVPGAAFLAGPQTQLRP